MLTHERLTDLLFYDIRTGQFRWMKEHRGRRRPDGIAGTTSKRGYVYITIDRKMYLAHRLAWFYVYGEWPEKLDHKDQNKGHNAILNLREATQSQNMINGRPDAGVYWHKGARKFAARIRHNYKTIHLGLFRTHEEALAARKAKAKELFGEFAA